MAKKFVSMVVCQPDKLQDKVLEAYDYCFGCNDNTVLLYRVINAAKEYGVNCVDFRGVIINIYDNFDINLTNDGYYGHYHKKYASYVKLDQYTYYGYLTIFVRCAKAGITPLINGVEVTPEDAYTLPFTFASVSQVIEIKNYLHKWCSSHSRHEWINYYKNKKGEDIATYDGGDGNHVYHRYTLPFYVNYYIKNDKFLEYIPWDYEASTVVVGKGKAYTDKDGVEITPELSMGIVSAGHDNPIKFGENITAYQNYIMTAEGTKIIMKTSVVNNTYALKGVVEVNHNDILLDKVNNNHKHHNTMWHNQSAGDITFADTDEDGNDIKDKDGKTVYITKKRYAYDIVNLGDNIKNILPLIEQVFGYRYSHEAISYTQFVEMIKYYINNYYGTDEPNDINYQKLVALVELKNLLKGEAGFTKAEYIINIKLYDPAWWNSDARNVIDDGSDTEEASAENNADDYNDSDEPVIANVTKHDAWYCEVKFSADEYAMINKNNEIADMLYGYTDINQTAIDAEYFIDNKDKFDSLFRNVNRSGYKIKLKIAEPTITKYAKIISGGQTGVDIWALQIAKEYGYETGGTIGYVNNKYIIEYNDGINRQQFNLTRIAEKSYPVRTEENVKNSDITLYFTDSEKPTAGYTCTKRACEKWHKPFVKNPNAETINNIVTKYDVVNIAGRRGSDCCSYFISRVEKTLRKGLKKPE